MSETAVLDRLDTGLRLEPQHAHIARRLAVFDPELRLRKSAVPERRSQGFGWILERKTRYTKPPDSAFDEDVQIATRDGYLIVSPVHVSYLMREEAIVEALTPGDLAHQTAGQRFTDIVNEQDAEKALRKKARYQDNKAFYAESFDVLDRLGDRHSTERTRLNNAGLEPFTVTDRRRFTDEGLALGTSAGEIPAQEISDAHPPPGTSRPEDGQLHDQRGR
jgi:hypothetical protein